MKEGVSVTIGNLLDVKSLALYFTGVHFQGELQYVGDVSEEKFKCRPIRSQEIGGVRLTEALFEIRNDDKKVSKDMLFFLVIF